MADQDEYAFRILGFNTTYEVNPETKKEDRAVDWVELVPHGVMNQTSTWFRISELIPPQRLRNDDEGLKLAAMRARWAQIEPAYELWKKGMEAPETGTALGLWPGINSAQAEAFRKVGVRTVEEVAEMDDNLVREVRVQNPRGLREQARIFLGNMGAANAAALDADREARFQQIEAQNKELSERLAAAMELIDQKTSPNDDGNEAEALRLELDAKGIEYDRRWGAAKLRDALEKASA